MEELMKFNPYEFSVEYNAHKGVHEAIENYYDREDFIDFEECVRKDKVFSIQVYPNNSVGFYHICASDYRMALDKMIETLEKCTR